jgi:hypothetical protein
LALEFSKDLLASSVTALGRFMSVRVSTGAVHLVSGISY